MTFTALQNWAKCLAIAVAWSIACLASAQAGSATLPASVGLPETEQSSEPFGLATSPLPAGDLVRKWLNVESRLDDEGVQLALCQADRQGCESTAALQFLAVIDNAAAHDVRVRPGD